MFIYSVRASTIKFFGIMLLGIAALVAVVTLIPVSDAGVSPAAAAAPDAVAYDNVKTNDQRIAFLSQFGWEVESKPCEEKKVTIPEEFDTVFTGYNDIQKAQGLDLSRYAKQEVTRYTYVVTNYPDYDGLVYANLLVCGDTVVGGDVSSADVAGFVHGFARPE